MTLLGRLRNAIMPTATETDVTAPESPAAATITTTFASIPTAPLASPAASPLPHPGSVSPTTAAGGGEPGAVPVRMGTTVTHRGPDGVETPVATASTREPVDPPVFTVGLPPQRWVMVDTGRRGLISGMPDSPTIETTFHGPTDPRRWTRAVGAALPTDRIAAAAEQIGQLPELGKLKRLDPQLREAQGRRVRAEARLEAAKANRKLLEVDPPENAAEALRKNQQDTEQATAELTAAEADVELLTPLRPKLEADARQAIERVVRAALVGWEEQLQARYDAARAEFETTIAGALENLTHAHFGVVGFDGPNLVRELVHKAMTGQPVAAEVVPLPTLGRRQTPG